MKRALLFFLITISCAVNAQNFDESTGGSHFILSQDDQILGGIGSSFRPYWEISENFYLGANITGEVYFADENSEFNPLVEQIDTQFYLGVGPSFRYYVLEYFYGAVDSSYNFIISGVLDHGIRVSPHLGYSFETFNLEAGYQFFTVDDFELGGAFLGLHFKL